MKVKIYQYLFFFTVLIALYFAVSSKNQRNFFLKQNHRVDVLKDSIQTLLFQNQEAAYFSIHGNIDALALFPEKTSESLEDQIKLVALNLNDPDGGNPLLSHIGSDCYINKVSLINHQWAIADFTNGTAWGEVLLAYKITQHDEVELIVLNYVWYP